jgi:hypothetical protein
MHRVIPASILLLTTLACTPRTNMLPVYADNAFQVAVVDEAMPNPGPYVTITAPEAKNKREANTIDTVSDAMANEMQARFGKIAPVASVLGPIAKRVEEGVPKLLKKSTLADAPAHADLRIELGLVRYGLDVAGGEPVAFASVNARMIHVKLAEKIWETTEEARVPIAEMPGLFDGPKSSLIESTALAALTDEQWRAVFGALADRGADAVLARIKADTVNHN